MYDLLAIRYNDYYFINSRNSSDFSRHSAITGNFYFWFNVLAIEHKEDSIKYDTKLLQIRKLFGKV